jgi:hypothetical protein
MYRISTFSGAPQSALFQRMCSAAYSRLLDSICSPALSRIYRTPLSSLPQRPYVLHGTSERKSHSIQHSHKSRTGTSSVCKGKFPFASTCTLRSGQVASRDTDTASIDRPHNRRNNSLKLPPFPCHVPCGRKDSKPHSNQVTLQDRTSDSDTISVKCNHGRALHMCTDHDRQEQALKTKEGLRQRE